MAVTSPERIGAMADAVRAEVQRQRNEVRAEAAAGADAYFSNLLHFAGAQVTGTGPTQARSSFATSA